MVTQVSKPGVNIRQVFEGTPPAPVTPQLIPCIVGPLYEVVDTLDASGAPNSAAKVVTAQGDLRYEQLPVSVDVSELPTPHADPSQMSVVASSVSALLMQRDLPTQLGRSSAFLTELNLGHRAGLFISLSPLSDDNGAVGETVINLALDNTTRDSVAADFHIPIAANDTAAQLAVKINAAVGRSVAAATTIVVADTTYTGLHIESARAGATSSVTLRRVSSGFVSTFLKGITDDGFDKTLRVEGAGLHAEDNPLPNVSSSPFVVHSRGAVFAPVGAAPIGDAPIETTALGAFNIFITQRDPFGQLTVGRVPEVDFSGLQLRAATATSDGDLLTATGPHGQSVSRVMVIGVQPTRLRLGVVDPLRSVYDADGNPTAQRYNDFSLNELGTSTPFAPRNGFVTARALTGDEANSAAVLSGGDLRGVGGYLAATAASITVTTTPEGFEGAVGLVGTVITSISGVPTTASYTFAVGDTIANVKAKLESAIAGVVVAVAGNTFTITTLEKGAHVSLGLSGAAWAALGTLSSASDAGTDVGLSDVVGERLTVSFNNSAKQYTVLAQSASLVEFVSDANDAIGFAALSLVDDDDADVTQIVVTSPLRGVASSVTVSSSGLGAILRLTASSREDYAAGEGRPLPELVVNASGAPTITADVLRSSLTGRPLSSTASVHIGYTALRLDVTADADQPGIIRVSNTDDVESIYGPIDVRNPLALGLYLALLNAGAGVEVTALGVDDVSDAEPNGTTVSYARALEFLRAYEIYALAPLSQSEDVIALCDAHVKDMSEPLMRGERVVISAPINPVRRNDDVLLSSGASGAESTVTTNQIDLNDSPEAALAAAGIDTGAEIPFQLDNGQQLLITLTIGDALHRRSVKSVDGARVTLRASTELTTAQNADGFYTSDDLPDVFSGAEFSLSLRGTLLTLAGSSRLDKTAYAETIRDKAQQYLNRRQLRLYPDTVVSSAIGGVSRRLPSFYWGAALAGACANLPAQEPFTRVPLVGFSDVAGPLLDRGHYDIISAGNSVIEVETAGQSPALRIQSTTDPTTIESREWSVTRAVDLFAKTMRNQLRARIGRFNITQSYLDELTLLSDSLCSSAVAAGLFRSAVVDTLEQDSQQPDRVLVVVRVEVLFPANYIDVTIVV